MNLKDSVQFEFGSVIGLLKREMESGPITDLYLNLICNKQLARECKQIACEPSLSSIFEGSLLSLLCQSKYALRVPRVSEHEFIQNGNSMEMFAKQGSVLAVGTLER